MIFDRYHVVAKANEAVETVRRAESKTRPELKRSRYLWLKNEAKLTANNARRSPGHPALHGAQDRTGRPLRDDFNEFTPRLTPKKPRPTCVAGATGPSVPDSTPSKNSTSPRSRPIGRASSPGTRAG